VKDKFQRAFSTVNFQKYFEETGYESVYWIHPVASTCGNRNESSAFIRDILAERLLPSQECIRELLFHFLSVGSWLPNLGKRDSLRTAVMPSATEEETWDS
jgi:hypothetical protein